MEIKTAKAAVKALEEVQFFIESKWCEDFSVLLKKEELEAIEGQAYTIHTTCLRMERHLKEEADSD